MNTRKVIPLKLRWKLYKEADFKCHCCGCDDVDLLEIDHIVPFSQGGPDDETNLQVLCRDCNSDKGKYQHGEIYNNMRKEDPECLYALIQDKVFLTLKEMGIISGIKKVED